eukprot:GHVR01047431.1.p1 GENE.GHVR01047431.1~~GHVR01047431.1.p1  ORF type:complete len:128 (+),score=32.03 GHVR01047431.1:86-469(+)
MYYLLGDIMDPEHPFTLSQLRIISPSYIKITTDNPMKLIYVTIIFKPTVPYCTLASIIGICIRYKLENIYGRNKYKINIYVKEGSHNEYESISKKMNDKERYAAALENKNLVCTSVCVTYNVCVCHI